MACKLHWAKPSDSKTLAAAASAAVVVVFGRRHPFPCGLAHPALGKHLDKQKRQQHIDEQHQQHQLLAHKPILQRNREGNISYYDYYYYNYFKKGSVYDLLLFTHLNLRTNQIQQGIRLEALVDFNLSPHCLATC